MHIHILGICGTFMGSLAQLAKASGHRVTGADYNVYPPMSTQLEAAGIELIEGFDTQQLSLAPDVFIIGNAISRGNPLMEEILDRGLPYTSGPQWLAEHILCNKWVLGVAGTHGKTTTSSMLAWILEYAGMSPGYLIGGVPGNFATSARLGESDFFVIEADEYDTAFFDKRSKFIHYHARTFVINNLEFDHADIFADLAAIQTQFHHVVRTIPRNGLVIHPKDPSIVEVLDRGCWADTHTILDESISDTGIDDDASVSWGYKLHAEDGSAFDIVFNGDEFNGQAQGKVRWALNGMHNVSNALSAAAAARHIGVLPEISAQALSEFSGVKRRMELLGDMSGVKVYDDFAHHPTAITTTLAGLRASVGNERIIAIIEPRSNTMKQGFHKESLLASVQEANEVYWFQDSALAWSLDEYVTSTSSVKSESAYLEHSAVYSDTQEIIEQVLASLNVSSSTPCHIVIMSNGGFQNIHQRLLAAINK